MKLSKNQNKKKTAPTDGDGKRGLRAIVIGDGALPHDMSLCWQATEAIEGHIPLFDIFCKYHPDTPMFMRYSHLTPKSLEFSRLAGRKNQIEYKCQKCGWIAQFFVDGSEEYFNKLEQLRIQQGVKEQYNPVDTWKENEKMEKQLSSLGYVGGREDMEEKK